MVAWLSRGFTGLHGYLPCVGGLQDYMVTCPV